MRVLTAEQMRQVDRAAIEELGIPSLVLMENAAIGVVDALGESFPEADRVAVFCGRGNNGGDGLAVARHLAVRGYEVEVFLVSRGKELEGDAAVQLGICRGQGLAIREVGRDEKAEAVVAECREADLVVDALFGTGLSRPLEGQYGALVEALSQLEAKRVAVDLPSGLSGSQSAIFGPCLEADLTVAFGAPKVAHVLPPACSVVGEVVVTDLGIPPRLVEEAEGGLHLLLAEELAPLLRSRRPDSHKGDYGHVLLVAGSPGKAGAAVMAAKAAVRGGTGLVTAAVPEPILATVDGASLESMTLALPAAAHGGLSEEAAAALLARASEMTVLALGPGLGQEESSVEAVRKIVLECHLPLVLDADGVNSFAGAHKELAKRQAETVLTPHPGELGRLLGIESGEVVADRWAAAGRAARETGALVILKGYRSLVATPEGEVFVNPTGNPGMASGGSGDVLTGLLAALLAQGHAALEASCLAVFLHGLAGDVALEESGEVSLAAGDILERLPEAFALLGGS